MENLLTNEHAIHEEATQFSVPIIVVYPDPHTYYQIDARFGNVTDVASESVLDDIFVRHDQAWKDLSNR